MGFISLRILGLLQDIYNNGPNTRDRVVGIINHTVIIVIIMSGIVLEPFISYDTIACLFVYRYYISEKHHWFYCKNSKYGTDRSEKKVQTQIRLLPKEQSDQGFYCLQLHLYFWMHYCSVNWKLRVCLVSHFLDFLAVIA